MDKHEFWLNVIKAICGTAITITFLIIFFG